MLQKLYSRLHCLVGLLVLVSPVRGIQSTTGFYHLSNEVRDITNRRFQ